MSESTVTQRNLAFGEVSSLALSKVADLNAQQLVTAITELRPDDTPSEQLRIALLLSLQESDLRALKDPAELDSQCTKLSGKLAATSDQHAAVATELDALALSAPCEFTPDHVWALVRAIKVQNQILNLYLG